MMEDCFRCHGMYFAGSIRDLVQPQNTAGPVAHDRARLANQPAMPCGTCHWIHREGEPEIEAVRTHFRRGRGRSRFAGVLRPPRNHALCRNALAIPQLYDGARLVNISQDPRQALCYQCHAPRHA